MSDISMASSVDIESQLTRFPRKNTHHLLSCFAYVIEHKSISSAAAVQCISKAQVLQHIAQLEGFVGVPLLHLQENIVVPTVLGKVLYASIDPMFKQLESGADSAISAWDIAPKSKCAIHIDMGIFWGSSTLRHRLLDQSAFGDAVYFSQQNSAHYIIPDVIFYFGKSPRDGYYSQRFSGDKMVAVCALSYPIPQSGFDNRSLRQEPLLQLSHPDHQIDWCSFLGIDPDVDWVGVAKESYSSSSTYLRAIKAGRGIGVGPMALFAADIAQGTLKIASNSRVLRNRSLFLGVLKHSKNIAQARDIAETLKKCLSEQVGMIT